MIFYDPTSGNVLPLDLEYKPRTCFIMTKLGKPIPQEITNIRNTLNKYLKQANYKSIDATSATQGKDFLLKIWNQIISVPIGIAIISKDLDPYTLANIFYEIGILQAYGKETLIIKTKDSYVPSDFVRTEYIEYDRSFGKKIKQFIKHLQDQAGFYSKTGELLKENPLLAVDYLRRAYLITGNKGYRDQAQSIFKESHFDKHSSDIFREQIHL